jgi:hypothetical protein
MSSVCSPVTGENQRNTLASSVTSGVLMTPEVLTSACLASGEGRCVDSAPSERTRRQRSARSKSARLTRGKYKPSSLRTHHWPVAACTLASANR